MPFKVALLEFSVWDRMVPLVGGLLEASALQRPLLRDACEFVKFSTSVRGAELTPILDIDADVYAVSCYVWNTGFVTKRLLPELLAKNPKARVLLGGPQVMHKADRYIPQQNDRVTVCNGEGEETFANYLEQLLVERGDLATVNGLSFYRRGTLVTTPPQSKIADFAAYPSPYLAGAFDDGRFMCAVVETNRGCPFKCTFCYWGAATNSQVRQFDQGRVMAEIEWASRNQVYLLVLADANFGMLKRDHEIAEWIAECRRRRGFPKAVSFSASKNTQPSRNAATVDTFAGAGLLSNFPVSIQSISENVLENVDRSNISTEGYVTLQGLLNDRGHDSTIELIFPLPGETLQSFKQGVAKLFRLGASTFNVFPLLLINNVPMETQREEFGLVTVEDPDPNSDAELVVQTNSVSHEDYLRGLRFIAHATTLLSCHTLRCVARTLDAKRGVGVDELIDAFDAYCQRRPEHPYVEYVSMATANSRFFSFGMLGSLLHRCAGVWVREVDQLLAGFMEHHQYWNDEEVRVAFELDLLNRPHIYSNQAIVEKSKFLGHLTMTASDNDDHVNVTVPAEFRATAARLLTRGREPVLPSSSYVINYKSQQSQHVYVAGKPDDNYNYYCTGILVRINTVLPRWTPVGATRHQ